MCTYMRLRAAKHPVFTRFCAYAHDVKVDQAGVEPASENPFIQVSPITVILY